MIENTSGAIPSRQDPKRLPDHSQTPPKEQKGHVDYFEFPDELDVPSLRSRLAEGPHGTEIAELFDKFGHPVVHHYSTKEIKGRDELMELIKSEKADVVVTESGLTANHEQWQWLLQKLMKEYKEIYPNRDLIFMALDRPGFGSFPFKKNAKYDVKDVDELAGAYEIEGIHRVYNLDIPHIIMGHSFGAASALRHAEVFGNRNNAYIALSTARAVTKEGAGQFKSLSDLGKLGTFAPDYIRNAVGSSITGMVADLGTRQYTPVEKFLLARLNFSDASQSSNQNIPGAHEHVKAMHDAEQQKSPKATQLTSEALRQNVHDQKQTTIPNWPGMYAGTADGVTKDATQYQLKVEFSFIEAALQYIRTTSPLHYQMLIQGAFDLQSHIDQSAHDQPLTSYAGTRQTTDLILQQLARIKEHPNQESTALLKETIIRMVNDHKSVAVYPTDLEVLSYEDTTQFFAYVLATAQELMKDKFEFGNPEELRRYREFFVDLLDEKMSVEEYVAQKIRSKSHNDIDKGLNIKLKKALAEGMQMYGGIINTINQIIETKPEQPIIRSA